MPTHEAGHGWIYRITALADPPESKYVLTPHEAQSLTRRLRSVGYEAQVARAPATAFVIVTDEELDLLVANNGPGTTR
ncbi:hypothetical protein ADL00_29600 [Streptomyces sp. AS58]|uniref:hypothetical protein n=1 Tax=Streptomyces sp. AS58 TaxID=1519489 RepID=UPI0006AE71A7|nr:hypothetical protein [Streptomyces sp. AS58]KOV54699.1 hypothetical protein ADL00_29600 [Streptomyces sp. AS58]